MNDIALEPVSIGYELDRAAGRRFNIGVVVLATDATVEPMLRALPVAADVAFYVNRVEFAARTTLKTLGAMADRLTEAASLILPGGRLDALAYACTSATVVIGEPAVTDALQAAWPGVPCATPIGGALAAFERLGARRIVVVTPYVDEVNERVKAYLARHGIEVLRFASFRLDSDLDMARVPPSAIADAVSAIDRDDADAAFVSCTALRAADVVEALERRLAKPVVASNQSMAWRALRLAGYRDQIAGFGRLMHL
jgi:maleate isomerase